MSPYIALAIAILMLAGNAFFVAVEFGLIAARRSNIELMAASGSRPAKITLSAMGNVSIMLAGVQLGVTLCSLILGAVGEPLFAHILEIPLQSLDIPPTIIHTAAFVIALSFMTYMHVVIGEMVPKNLSLANPEKIAILLTPILVVLVKISRPIVILLNTIANTCLNVLGVPRQNEIASTFTRDEVAGFIDESKREGLISEDEGYLLTNAIVLHEKTVIKVTIPLSSLVVIGPQTTPREVEKLSAETGFSRFPIISKDGSLTHYIHLKDVLNISHSEHAKPIPKKAMRTIAQISSRSTMRTALSTMQKLNSHLASVTDKNHKVIGVITLEDLLEEFIGEIRDDSKIITNNK